jgi:glucose-1-phosphate thymidylyltransferase
MIMFEQHAIESVGLIPAGGKAERIAPLPCSKEIFPVGFGDIRQNDRLSPKVAAHYLLEKMRLAGAQKAFVVLSKGKWDIPAYFGSGSMLDMALAYLMTDLPYGVPFTLDSAFPFLKNKRVLLGFPDILFQPDDGYVQLIERMDCSRADIVLGLFPADRPQKMDMVALNTDGAIADIDIKPARTSLKWTWIMAVWDHAFTQFMHESVQRRLPSIDTVTNGSLEANRKEIFVGDVIREALGTELKIDQVMFPQGTYIDIGSPEDLRVAVKTCAFEP